MWTLSPFLALEVKEISRYCFQLSICFVVPPVFLTCPSKDKRGKKGKIFLMFSYSVSISSGNTYSKINNVLGVEPTHVCFKGYKQSEIGVV